MKYHKLINLYNSIQSINDKLLIKNFKIGKIDLKRKVALITGITGQDGSYLAEFLIKKNTRYMELKDVVLLLILKELIIFMKILILRTQV